MRYPQRRFAATFDVGHRFRWPTMASEDDAMSWSPEMEIIDQLLGGDLPLAVICRLFPDDSHARRALAQYASQGVVEFVGQEGVLPTWRLQEMFRCPEPLEEYTDVRVSLTDKGAAAFEEGNWNRL